MAEDLYKRLIRGTSLVGEKRKSSSEPVKVSKKPRISEPENADALRRALGVKIRPASDGYRPWTTFDDLEEDVSALLRDRNIDEPTPVQAQTISLMMERRDCVVCAPTGTGKTLAYLLPAFSRLKGSRGAGSRAHPKVLVVLPTQELCQQVYDQAKLLAQGTFSQVVVSVLKDDATWQADLLITTPLTAVYALKKNLKLDRVELLVLDEADLLLDLGLLSQTDEIVAAALARPDDRARPQFALLTATLPSNVEELASSILESPVRVIVGHKGVAMPSIEQKLQFVGDEDGKLSTLRQWMREGMEMPVLIFVQSIERADQLYRAIKSSGYKIAVMHSSLDKSQRTELCSSFRQGKVSILITTDLFSRGLDFPGLAQVINYDFPLTTTSYLHRIGRTGRAGEKGRSVTFFTVEDQKALKSVVNVMQASGSALPSWMLHLPKTGKNERRLMQKRPKKRDKIGRLSVK